MMKEGVRDPVSHMTPAQRRASYKRYHGTAVQKKRRAMRNSARAAAVKAGTAKKGDGKDVDHKKMLSKGGTNAPSNTRVVSKKVNRGHGTSPGGNGRKRLQRGTS